MYLSLVLNTGRPLLCDKNADDDCSSRVVRRTFVLDLAVLIGPVDPEELRGECGNWKGLVDPATELPPPELSARMWGLGSDRPD